jgi:glycosyltransferase involved in cell wall biosynthesis
MNIGIIHGFVGGGGGTEKTLHAILEALEQTDHHVTLYTFSKPKINSNKIKIKKTIPVSLPSFGLLQRAMESKLISKAKDEDLLIQSSGGLGIPKNPDQKIIVYCHADFSSELENPDTKYKGLWRLYYKSYYSMIQKFVQNISDPRIYLISNSQYIQNCIKEKHSKNSEIIYPPVDLGEFQPGIKENNVVTIGRYSEEKHHDFGINVMKDLEYDYDIIGNTNTKSNILYYEKLKNIIKTVNNKNIHLLKNLERNNLVEKINKSKIYFHCSTETFGISVVESIAAGCIPIVPNNSAHQETVPFEELRYEFNNIHDAQEKINQAISGKLDHFKKPLQESIKKYDEKIFKKSFLLFLENLLNN